MGVQLAAVVSGDPAEGVVVAPPGGLEQLALARGRHRASRSPPAFRPPEPEAAPSRVRAGLVWYEAVMRVLMSAAERMEFLAACISAC